MEIGFRKILYEQVIKIKNKYLFNVIAERIENNIK